MIKVEIMSVAAQIEGGVWKCSHLEILALLMNETERLEKSGDYFPDFDFDCADYLTKKYGGRIISAPPVHYSAGLIY